MTRLERVLLPVFAAAAVLASAVVVSGASAAGPGNVPLTRFKLSLSVPMQGDRNARLEPGEYDVTFEPSPAGPPRFIAVFFRGGVRVATAPAELKGAPPGATLPDAGTDWIQGTFDHKHVRKNGAINPAKFDFKAKSSRAFYEALLTEVAIPALDGASKAPEPVLTAVPPRVTLPKN